MVSETDRREFPADMESKMGGKPEFLSFRCIKKRGKHADCTDCPLNPLRAGHKCEEFCQYMEKMQDFLLADRDELAAVQSRTDPASLLSMTLFRLESVHDRYNGVNSFQGFIRGIFRKLQLQHLRNYNVSPITLSRLRLEFEASKLQILAGDVLPDRKISYAFIPKENQNVAENASSILIVDSVKPAQWQAISEPHGLLILTHGTVKPRSEWIAKLRATGSVLLWLAENISGYELKNKINNLIRNYVDINVSLGASTNEQEVVEEDSEDGFRWEDFDSAQSNGEIARDFMVCVEKMLVDPDLKECAGVFLLYISVEKALEGDDTVDDQAFFKGGKLKKTMVYDEIARQTGKTADAVKRQYLRCLENDRVYQFLKKCMDGYGL